MDLITLYRGTVDTWLQRLDDIGGDQWDDPTPCSDWNVRALVNHVVGEDLWTEPLMRGRTIAEVGDAFDGDVLGDDPKLTGRTAAAGAVGVVSETLPSGGTVQLSYGEEQMAEYISQLAADHLVHAWDLAAATGGDTTLEPDLVAGIAAWYADREEMYRGAGVVGPRQEAGGDAASDLLAAFGRSSSWTAPATR